MQKMILAVILLLATGCTASTETRDKQYVLYGPEFKYISSGETVPDDDKLGAGLVCDLRFENAWLEKNGKGSARPISDPKVAAVVLMIKTGGALSKTQQKARHMVSCLAEDDMVQLDQTEGIWWPTRYSLK